MTVDAPPASDTQPPRRSPRQKRVRYRGRPLRPDREPRIADYWAEDPTARNWLVPLFPVGPLNRTSKCTHGKLPRESRLCCVICHRSGWDHHPALRLHTDNPPGVVETRRQRRMRTFGLQNHIIPPRRCAT